MAFIALISNVSKVLAIVSILCVWLDGQDKRCTDSPNNFTSPCMNKVPTYNVVQVRINIYLYKSIHLYVELFHKKLKCMSPEKSLGIRPAVPEFDESPKLHDLGGTA